MNRENVTFLIKIIIAFLVVSFVVDKIVYFGFNKVSQHVYTGQSVGKLNQFLELKDSLEFIAFGSSRANHNIDPDLISPDGFNMGINGTDISYAAALIKTLPLKKRQIILLHIDSNSPFDPEYKGRDIKALAIKYYNNAAIRKEIDRLDQNNPLQKFYWSIGFNGYVFGILKNFIKPSYNYKKFNGYDPIYVSDVQKKIFQNILKKERPANCPQDLVLNETYNTELDELKEFAEKNNKKLVFFTSPELKDVCKDDNKKLAEIMKAKNLRYYDLTDYFRENTSMDYWKDGIHLSNVGAGIFMDTIVKITR